MWNWILLAFVLIQSSLCEGDQSQSQSLQFSPRDGKGWGWDSDKSTFFDIALTALAFLSFGVFLLNLLLNALLFPTTGTSQLTQPAGPILTMVTNGGTGGAIITGTGIGRRFRRRRQLFAPEIDQETAARFLLKFVTTSIESMTLKHECLPQIICDSSRKASIVGSRFQLMFSVISISISYVGKLLGLHDDLQKHFDALMVGARNKNCKSAFPTCNR